MIKLPVRATIGVHCRIDASNGTYVCSTSTCSERDEIIRAINGYDKAVKALQAVYSDGDGWGKSLAWEALKDLGEIDESNG